MFVKWKKSPIICHLLFVLLMILIALPGKREVASPSCFIFVACLIEVICIWGIIREKQQVTGDIGAVLFGVLVIWEWYATVINQAHTILIPTPEAVFRVFVEQYELMIRGIGSSLSLLAMGFAIALPLGVILGITAGWYKRFRDTAVPVARIMSPIPAIIYAPYLVALMPSFRSASVMIIVLGIFWPTFLQTVERVQAVDTILLDNAKVMALTNWEMITQIFLPWLFPGVLSGLRVSLSTSFMLLMLAEMMGATSGLGYFIKNYSDYANYACVIAGIILVALVITALNALMNVIEKKCVPWKTE